MKAPHKSLMDCVAKDASRYAMNGLFIKEVPFGSGGPRAAWCATDGKMLVCEALSEANAQEVRDDPRGYNNALFDVTELTKAPIFRVEGTKMLSQDGATFPLREATAPDVGWVMRDVMRAKRCSIEVDADLLSKALAVAVAKTRKGAKEESGMPQRAVVLSFEMHDDVATGCDVEDAIVKTSPILVRPLNPERAERFAAVLMQLSESHDERKDAEKRGKKRERSLKLAEKRAEEAEAKVAILEAKLAEALATAQSAQNEKGVPA